MIFESLDAMATVAVAAFVNGVWPGMLLAGTVWLLMRLTASWQPLNATTRFIVWTTVMASCAGLVAWQGARQIDFFAVDPMLSHDISALHAEDRPDRSESRSIVSPAAPETASDEIIEATPDAQFDDSIAAQSIVVADDAIAAEYEPVNENAFPDRIEWTALGPVWRRMLFIVWGLVSGLLMLRIGYSILAVRELKRRSLPAPDALRDRLDIWLKRIPGTRRVSLRISKDIDIAVATGFFTPTIMAPASLLRTLNSEELEQVLLHEMAHLQRRDDWTILLQRVLTALLFFHPALYALGRLMDREREFACDDWVVALTRRPKAYASCLARIVALRRQARGHAFAPAIVSGKQQLFERVRAILNIDRKVSYRVSLSGYVIALCLMIIVMFSAVRLAPVIAFPQQSNFHPAVADSDRVETPRPEIEPTAPRATAAADEPNEESAPDAPLPIAEDQEPIEASRQALAFGHAAPIESSRLEAPEAQPLPEAGPADVPPLSKRAMIRLLASARNISSSGDKAALLVAAVDRLLDDPEVFETFLETTATVASPGDRARVLVSLLDAHALDAESSIVFLRVAAEIPSPGDKARVLAHSINREALPLSNDAVYDAFMQALETVHSPDDYNRVATLLLKGRGAR